MGRDWKRKGGQQVIDAFKILKQEFLNLELHFAGPKSLPKEYLVDGLHFYGDADRKTISDLMNKCDVFCMPSYFEAYGLVFIEALSFGLPCIGRNRYEMPYFIEDGKTGLLVNTEDPSELAEKIKTILQDDSFADNVKKRQQYYLKEYSWETVAQRIANIINAQ